MAMTPVVSVLLLAVLILVNRADGIRSLENEYSTAGLHTKDEEKRSLMEEGFRADKGCESYNDHCAGKGRQLETHALGTVEGKRSKEMSLAGEPAGRHKAKQDIDRSRENQVESPADTNPQSPTYPDVLDIAGMDYSPAKRKAPIHN